MADSGGGGSGRRDDQPPRISEFMDGLVGLAAGDGDHHWSGAAISSAELERQRRLLHLERLGAVSRLAAGLAHEINNPVAFLQANLTVAREQTAELRRIAGTTPGPEQLHRAQQIADELATMADENLQGLKRIARVARGLLGISATDPQRFGPTDLKAVAEEACGLADREVKIRARLVKRLESVPLASVDGPRLVQVAADLLVSAASAVPAGDPQGQEVEISTGVSGGRGILEVRDTGAAIPDALGDRVFEPFVSLPARTFGSGLELFMAAEVLRGHGGGIRWRPAGRSGTVFQAYLPLLPGVAPAAADGELHRPRVLVVDDETTLLTAYRRLLADRMDLVTASGGREALEQLERDAAFDAIVCDLVMPDLDGQGLYHEVVARFPSLAPRMVFCTAGAFTSRDMAFAATMRGRVLAKPFEPEMLEALLRRLATDW